MPDEKQFERWLREGERVEGDPSNVLGLSMPLLRVLLAELGVTLVDLWAGPAGALPA